MGQEGLGLGVWLFGSQLAERLQVRGQAVSGSARGLWGDVRGVGLTSQPGGSPTTLVHTIPGRMLLLPRAACRRLQALGPRRVTGTV